MKKRFNYIEALKSKDPDKLIKAKFSFSYMNDSKWEKLMETLLDKFDQIYLNYKLIYTDEISGNLFYKMDFKPFFIEPIFYNEIEWIEIPKTYEDWLNDSNRKAGKKFYSQDFMKVKSEIEKIGKFEMEINDKSIRIYGHKR